MAIPFLNHLDLRSVSELQNAILHKTTESSASDIEGKIIYDTGTDTIKYYSGSSGSGAWISLGAEAHSFKTISITGTSGQDDVVADATTDTLTLNAGSNVSITTNASTDTITISSTDTNTQLTQEQVEDFVDGLLTEGEGIDLTYDDNAGTLLIKGEDADTSNKGIASFSSDNFSVTSGAVTIKDGGVSNDELVNSSITINGSAISLGGSVTTPNTDTLQSIADSNSTSEQFVTFVANATGAQTGLSDPGIKYIPSSGTLKVTNLIVDGDTTTANETVKVVENNTLQFEGASGTDSAHELNLTTAVLSTDRTITLPNATGTVALTSDITGTNSGTNTGDQNLYVRIDGDTGSLSASDTSGVITFSGGTNVTTAVTGSGNNVDVKITSTDTNTQLSTAAALIDVSAMAGNNTASFTHGLSSKNLIVQMYDTTSGLVVFADVDHTSNNAISITFSQTGTEMVADSIGDIRVVVIDAKNGLSDKTVSYS
jgi:hypothetical protein